jgi:hypothetical protein
MVATVHNVKKDATSHPQVMTTGPPVSNPKLITRQREVMTAIDEKVKLNDMKALNPLCR